MKRSDLEALIAAKDRAGYRVSFEQERCGGYLSNLVPDKQEAPCSSLDEAWDLAAKLARLSDSYVNVYVVHGDTYVPVEAGHLLADRRILNRGGRT